jgi:hypothetical protein
MSSILSVVWFGYNSHPSMQGGASFPSPVLTLPATDPASAGGGGNAVVCIFKWVVGLVFLLLLTDVCIACRPRCCRTLHAVG